MSTVKKNRLDEARIAKAYIAGGMAPYQAARKCGFMRVTAMEEAFRELAALEADEKTAASESEFVKPAEEDASQYLVEASNTGILKPVFVPKVNPIETFESSVGSIRHLGETAEKSAVWRIDLKNCPSYLMVQEKDFQAFAQLVMQAAGLKVQSNDHLLAEFANLQDEMQTEAQAHLKELQRNEQLQERLQERLQEAERDCRKMHEELKREQAEHQALKLRVFDLLLNRLDGK